VGLPPRARPPALGPEVVPDDGIRAAELQTLFSSGGGATGNAPRVRVTFRGCRRGLCAALFEASETSEGGNLFVRRSLFSSNRGRATLVTVRLGSKAAQRLRERVSHPLGLRKASDSGIPKRERERGRRSMSRLQ